MIVKTMMLSKDEARYVSDNAERFDVRIQEYTKHERYDVVQVVGHDDDVKSLLKNL